MPAQIQYILYVLVSVVIFPITLFNFILLNTPLFSNLKPYIVTTGSMEPVIPAGSLIYSVKERIYKIGDMVTYNTLNGTIAHRIEKIIPLGGEIYFSTKGDANLTGDIDLIHPAQIQGKITTIIPHIGTMVDMYKNPIGYWLGILFPAFIIILLHWPRKNYKATS